jgi:predicted Zn-dependent protease
MAYNKALYSSDLQRAIAIIVMAWFGVGLLGLSQPLGASGAGFTLMSETSEIETGRKLDEEIGHKLGFYTEAKLQAYVTEVGQRLVRAGSPRSFAYSFKIVDMPEANAFASMGGFVYITRGMLAELNSEAELAGVLAHEIAHISHRHVPKQLTRAFGYQLLGLGAMALGATLGNADNNLGKAPLGISAALMTILRSYSQEAELEADELGLLLMSQAGYDPRYLVAFLRNLRARERLTGTGYHGMLATHPETAERIAKADIMAQLLAAEQTANDPKEDGYKSHLEGLPYGDRRERLRLDLYRVQPGDTLASLRHQFQAEGERRWDVARLNRLRNDDALRPGMLVKVVVADHRPLVLPQRRLEVSEERPVPLPPPPPVPTRRSRVPLPRN